MPVSAIVLVLQGESLPSSLSTGKVHTPTCITHHDELSDEVSDNVQ